MSMLVYMVADAAEVPWFAGHGHGWAGPSFGHVLGVTPFLVTDTLKSVDVPSPGRPRTAATLVLA
jgi:biotin transporter BioY